MKRYVIAIAVIVVMSMLLSAQTGAVAENDKPIVPKEKMILWNGKDFSGWKLFTREPEHDVTK